MMNKSLKKSSKGIARTTVSVVLLTTMIVALFCGLLSGLIMTAIAAEEPAQTYDIRSADDFKAYSIAYASGYRNPKDVLNISINSGSVVTDDGFISIGSSSRPFAGTIIVPAAGVDVFHLFNCPLFDYVSTDFTIAGAGTIKIMRERANEQPAAGVLTSGSLFANHVVKGTNAANWSINHVEFSPVREDSNPASSFDGVIGDIASNAEVTISFTNVSDMDVSGSGNTGLICGTLKSGASLTVSTSSSG